jgi:hypothetical protein
MSSSKAKEILLDEALFYFNVEGWNCTESGSVNPLGDCPSR